MKQKKDLTESNQIIEDILKPHTKEILSIVAELRDFFKEEFPSLIEKGYPMWKGIGYSDSKSGYLCAIFPLEGEVKLGFEYGIILKDKDNVLKGDGKQLRYIVITNESEINRKQIKDFVKQSLALPVLKKDKLAMIDLIRKA
ncbi:MAG TPA: DUF1801 domain-containing protein [Leptospiraceae bacterium]|nr:DUF1801 domain-containing protein [Leptospiraceae bacterium]HMW05499.1 DUF1801 domain-containing protein [Leptospiraceae bacterium]HMX32474.1 DUF1801 domain-containing protein [Leptospiraceae bacterium]HMY31009.1 DUF1801 domain-containing protein [Leptospiraceae bacterium]HMZ65043.1 DUF1801 domain-containing protein [Leptospiraceae bacterium]